MPEYRRWYVPGGTFFFTAVTHGRRPMLGTDLARRYLKAGGEEITPSRSRLRHAERGIWQRRYWEHAVRDEEDLKRCVDYVHWNPKKHGHLANVRDWRWSSFHRFVRLGEYTADWGAEDPTPGKEGPEGGEKEGGEKKR